MIGVVSLSSASAQKPLEIGSLVTLEIAADGRVGQPIDGWSISPAPTADWFPSGSLLLSAGSLRVAAADGTLTKLTIDGLVRSPGELRLAPFKLVHAGDGAEVEISETLLAKDGAKPLEQGSPPPAWLLPPAPIGGWNVWMLVFLGLIALTALGLAVRAALARWALRAQAKWNLRDRTLRDLQLLEKYARSQTIDQEQWKRFSFDLAKILRRYTDENFRMDSADMTDREFLGELRFHQAAKTHVDRLAHILTTITEVRYGTKTLESQMMPALLQDGRAYVEGTYIPEKEDKK